LKKKKKRFLRFGVLAEVTAKNVVFSYVTLRCLTAMEGTDDGDGGSTCLRNVSELLPYHKALDATRRFCLYKVFFVFVRHCLWLFRVDDRTNGD
jgi:hypothetical protein